ncbi:Pleckstrin homology domain-containing protein 1 [Bienertia sinuspersici]
MKVLYCDFINRKPEESSKLRGIILVSFCLTVKGVKDVLNRQFAFEFSTLSDICVLSLILKKIKRIRLIPLVGLFFSTLDQLLTVRLLIMIIIIIDFGFLGSV